MTKLNSRVKVALVATGVAAFAADVVAGQAVDMV